MRPRVLVNMAPSLDGKIAQARKTAPFVMSRHPEDHKRMRDLRARADAVMIGATNLRADDPDLMPCALRVVVTRRGDGIETTQRIFGAALGGEVVVAHAAPMPESKRRALSTRATLLELGATDVDLSALLQWLARERNCRVVLSEGGGVLNAELLRARALDEFYVTIVPRILGGTTAPTMVGGNGFEPDEIPDLRLASCERIGDELFLRYELSWSEETDAAAPANELGSPASMNASVVSEPEIDAGTVVLRVVVENLDDPDAGNVFVCRLRGFEDVTVEAFPEGFAPGSSGENRAAAAEAVKRYALENRERLEALFAQLPPE
jgi:riboflavin-specific deaminase-like protein